MSRKRKPFKAKMWVGLTNNGKCAFITHTKTTAKHFRADDEIIIPVSVREVSRKRSKRGK